MANEILEEIKKSFADKVVEDKKIKSFLKSIQNKRSNFLSLQNYARRLGEILGDEISKKVKTMTADEFKELASQIIIPMLKQNHDLVMIASEDVQKIIDQKQALKLGAVKSKFDRTRADEVIKDVIAHDTIEAMISETKRSVGTFTERSYDDFIRDNASFRSDIGISTWIVREYEGPHKEHTDHKNGGEYVDCPYCQPLAGTWEYSKAPNNVYWRHKGCHCTVTYVNNVDKYIQNAHTKIKRY